MNDLWKRYGCTKCNDYELLVLIVNFDDSKSEFEENYINTLGATAPCVASTEGGSVFNDIFSKGEYVAGTKYLIAPDRTLIGNDFIPTLYLADETHIIAAGIKEHECATPINFNVKILKNGIRRIVNNFPDAGRA